jgi:hypothetical protein
MILFLLIYVAGIAAVMLHFENPKHREDLPTALLIAGILLWPLALIVAAYIKIKHRNWH